MHALDEFSRILQEIGPIDSMEVSVGSDYSISITAISGGRRRVAITGRPGDADGCVFDYSKPTLDGYFAYQGR